MEHLLNQRVKDIQISGIRKFFSLVSQVDGAISLTIGQPDFPTPEHIKKAAKQAIDDNKTVYTLNAGLIELRNAASNFLNVKYGLTYSPEEEIITTVGASEAIELALRTILDEGSEVILPGPVYPGYEPLIRLCGAKPVIVDTANNDFVLTADLITAAITDKTRCIILPYPSNPTGRTLDEKTIEAIADLLKDKEIFVVSDEIYSELVYDGEHRSIASYPALRDKTIVINGLSKSHSMTGWRIGFTFAPSYITKQMLKVHQYLVSCASSISQYAALEALTDGLDDAKQMRDEYKKRRDYVHSRLESFGLDVVKPEGAFYLFPSIAKYNMSSFDFCTRLLHEAKVAVVPGDAFSQYGEGYIRISYAYSMDVLKESLDRMETFLQGI